MKLESLLSPLAEEVCPEGTELKAIVHQWVHALSYDQELFGEFYGPNNLREQLILKLKDAGLFKSTNELKNKLFEGLSLKPVEMPTFSFIDLFAGIGGMRLGFQNQGGVCVFSSEFDKHAQVTYQHNHGEFPFGDITKVNASHIPKHDVLIAGFPCQPFSHAGLKLGVDDTRGTLFHDIARILEEKKPKFALLENVKGLIGHDKGYTLQVVLRKLTKIGYSCNISKDIIQNGSAKDIKEAAKKMVLKSIDFGVPQNRQRIYIVLWRDGLIRKFNYPVPLDIPTRVGDVLESAPEEKLTISDRLWAGHQRRKIENKKNGKGFGFGIVTPDSAYTNTISARYYKDGSEILIAQSGKNPRKLSTREAARIQGFPEEFIPNKSNVQAYKQFGNSVTVPVLTSIAKILKRYLDGVN